ncbi:MAG: MBL fold metallo-hydrolase [Cyanobacteria bacterium J06632_3]
METPRALSFLLGLTKFGETFQDRSISSPPVMINTASPSLTSRSQTAQPNLRATQIAVKFWGVRGSVPTPVETHHRYGGNTACVEITLGGQHLIFDGGTGIVNLGHHLHRQSEQGQQAPLCSSMFFTHTQWDRIQGFPFFKPAFDPKNQFNVYGGTAPNGASIKHCLTDQMLLPHFTVPLQNMLARLSFKTLFHGTHFNIGDVEVEVQKINPLTEALGYRLTWQGYTIVYATDTPKAHVELDFLQLADQADLLIYDGTYDDLSYLHHQPAGRAAIEIKPWETATELAQKANVKKLVLLHHSPVQDDVTLDQLQIDIRDRVPSATIAYEGLVIEP